MDVFPLEVIFHNYARCDTRHLKAVSRPLDEFVEFEEEHSVRGSRGKHTTIPSIARPLASTDPAR
jgi:hypothetical protein